MLRVERIDAPIPSRRHTLATSDRRRAQQAAEKESQDEAAVAQQEADLQLQAANKEVEQQQKHGADIVAFVMGEASEMQTRFATSKSIQMDQMTALKNSYPTVFVGTFFERMEEFALDCTQDKIELVGTIADFIPGYGTVVSIVADGINAAIYAARGKRWEAGASVFSMIPLGNIAKRVGLTDAASKVARTAFKQLGNGLSAASRFVPIPALGDGARRLVCPALKKVGIRGFCFVGETEVHYLAAGRSAWLVTAAGVFAIGATGLIVTRPRRGKDDEDAVDQFMTDDGGDWPDIEPTLPDTHLDEEPFEQLCDRLFNGEQEQETDWVAEAMFDDASSQNNDGPLSLRERARVRAQTRRSGSGKPTDQRSGTVPFTPTVGVPPLGGPRQSNACAPVGTSFPIAAPSQAAILTPEADSECGTATLNPPASENCTMTAEKPAAAIPKPKPKKKRRYFSIVGLVWMLAALALSGFCLFKGLTGSHPDTKPIDQFQVGMIVPPDILHGDNDMLYGERVSPKTWRHLFVEGKKDDGSRWDADLLVPLWWITEQQAKVGGQVHISVPECGIDGLARVVTLGPCPKIHDIDGRVVTSVFRHHSANVLDLHIEGLDEPIGTTANHPFFSVDRAEFVRADELQPGEMLRLIDGSPIPVISSTPRPGAHTVYNLQVSVDHVYHVTEAGVLVHNGDLELCQTLASSIRTMGLRWEKGGLKKVTHVQHMVDMGLSQTQYDKAARALAKKSQNVIEKRLHSHIYKYDLDTGNILIVHLKNRRIKTFYHADHGLDSFNQAMAENYKHLIEKGLTL